MNSSWRWGSSGRRSEHEGPLQDDMERAPRQARVACEAARLQPMHHNSAPWHGDARVSVQGLLRDASEVSMNDREIPAFRQVVTDNRSSRAELVVRVERLESIVQDLVIQLAEMVASRRRP